MAKAKSNAKSKKSDGAQKDSAEDVVWRAEDVREWFVTKIDAAWFVESPSVKIDREEIQIVGVLTAPDADKAAPEAEVEAAGRIALFREDTRDARIAIARQAEAMWGRKVSWGARCGARVDLFTVASVPVMTRLRLDERLVLDTLIDANVARSRSEALAWCVQLVAKNEGEWIDRLRDALTEVERVRGER